MRKTNVIFVFKIQKRVIKNHGSKSLARDFNLLILVDIDVKVFERFNQESTTTAANKLTMCSSSK